MGFDLNGKTAIVTGAARGIGLAISERFAELGATVSGWDLSTDVAKGATCFAHLVDVDGSDEASVNAGVAASCDVLDQVDILVANAGINGPTKPAWDYTLAEWQQVIDVDLTGVFLSTRAVLPEMRARGTGRIIVTSSVAGKEGNPGACAYGAAKSGVIGYVKGLARELLPSEITVNCVAPGFIATAMTDKLTDDQKDKINVQIPAGRMGTPEEIAAATLYLASAEAAYVTGTTLHVNGGMAML